MSDQNTGEKDCFQTDNAAHCFSLLIPDDLEFLNAKKAQVSYLKGETVFKQGAFAPHVLYVVEGLVKVFLQTGGNKQMNIRLARQGEFIAFTTVFEDTVYPYSAVAIKDAEICMIDKTALKQLLYQNPDFALRITARNCQNEKRYLEMIQNLSYKQMRGKLASALLYLSDEFIDERVFLYLTRQELADFASITIESTVKFLKEFERDGVILLEGKDILITDKARLEDIYQKG